MNTRKEWSLIGWSRSSKIIKAKNKMNIKLMLRKRAHIKRVSDHIYYLHTKKVLMLEGIENMEGTELERRVVEIQKTIRRTKRYRIYYKLLIF
jgi:hypothetical protein